MAQTRHPEVTAVPGCGRQLERRQDPQAGASRSSPASERANLLGICCLAELPAPLWPADQDWHLTLALAAQGWQPYLGLHAEGLLALVAVFCARPACLCVAEQRVVFQAAGRPPVVIQASGFDHLSMCSDDRGASSPRRRSLSSRPILAALQRRTRELAEAEDSLFGESKCVLSAEASPSRFLPLLALPLAPQHHHRPQHLLAQQRRGNHLDVSCQLGLCSDPRSTLECAPRLTSS
mmetsp:Transcript_7207/g.13337  ORF Transcript_7207/g.13337 Transcript_7207/m.13337 type:complete len:236 (-) Transcript_7207:524-1231(-)